MTNHRKEGGKKTAKIGRNRVKCARYALRHGLDVEAYPAGSARRHHQHRRHNPRPLIITGI